MPVAISDINISLLDIRIEAFKRGLFDFITVRDGRKHKKQEEALQILCNDNTEEFAYGGAAGGAKSWTGCSWLMFMCLAYPETKWFIGREELKRITESTLITFYKVAKAYGVRSFKFNAQKNVIVFDNGSRIDLLELKYLPRDPMFERFGSTEYTGGWIEEAGEIDFGAYDVIKTRVGRHYNDKYGIRAKLFMTCNPKKNWLYNYFYKPFTKSKLDEPLKRFLQAFAQDNPFIESGYIERLKRTEDKSKLQRLYYGNWDYDDDPNVLCSYDDIMAIFSNDHVKKESNHYLTADVARLGSDKAIILVWRGWVIVDYATFDISKTTQIQNKINEFRSIYGISHRNCVADEDGIGGGVVDNCWIEGFVNNAKPMAISMPGQNEEVGKHEIPNYNNYQTQCGYYLIGKINTYEIWFEATIKQEFKQEIAEELGQLKSYKVDDDRKVYLLPKKEVKQNIGRSPDWRDALLMRAHFDLRPKRTVVQSDYNANDLGLF